MTREDKGVGGGGGGGEMRARSKKSEKRRFHPCIQRQDYFDNVLVFPLVASA